MREYRGCYYFHSTIWSIIHRHQQIIDRLVFISKINNNTPGQSEEWVREYLYIRLPLGEYMEIVEDQRFKCDRRWLCPWIGLDSREPHLIYTHNNVISSPTWSAPLSLFIVCARLGLALTVPRYLLRSLDYKERYNGRHEIETHEEEWSHHHGPLN